jgi:hypothetical protein
LEGDVFLFKPVNLNLHLNFVLDVPSTGEAAINKCERLGDGFRLGSDAVDLDKCCINEVV